MTAPPDCSHNTDPLRLVREGTSQDQRKPEALDPGRAPVDEREPAHRIVFAQGYAALLKYFNAGNVAAGDWAPFFAKDVAALLAVAAIEDIEDYKANVNARFDVLNRRENQTHEPLLKDNLGFLYSAIASLASQLDALKDSLPGDIALKGTLQNLIATQLAPAFRRLIAYYKAGTGLGLVGSSVPAPAVMILRSPIKGFTWVLSSGLSKDWSEGQAWDAYAAGIAQDASVYGVPADVFTQINHCATHNLFKSVFDQFLKVFARVVGEAARALDETLTRWNAHEPHYALFLAFLRLLEYGRSAANTLTARHLDFYFREILRLKEKGAKPGEVHLLVELAKQAATRQFKVGEPFKAGKDGAGRDAFFANDADFVANQAKVAALKTVYRHGAEPVVSANPTGAHEGRIYASPVANSDDGVGAPLTSPDQSWHPFFNKIYADGALSEIRMPEAEVGFAIASHYLLLAEGDRTVTVDFTLDSLAGAFNRELNFAVVCQFTTEKGWFEVPASKLIAFSDTWRLIVELSGAAPPVTPYVQKTHGRNFTADLPILMVQLRHLDGIKYFYSDIQGGIVERIDLTVQVDGLKTLALANDFGPVDASKPFQPFGASPVTGSALVLGSKEIFQKKLTAASVNLTWLAAPAPHKTSPTVVVDFLSEGEWQPAANAAVAVTSADFPFDGGIDPPDPDVADFSPNEPYATGSRRGYVRLKLSEGFGQDTFQSDLLAFVRKDTTTPPGSPPLGPAAAALSVSYTAKTTLALTSSAPEGFEKRAARFFHVAPFGTAERHPYLNPGGPIYVLPQFDFRRDAATVESEAELYIGVSGLAPPQNLSLLFQVADGTANPLAVKPPPRTHLDWSYLKDNEWVGFAENEVQDATGELLNSGIVTLAVPRQASASNTLFPAGMLWIRAAVREKSDAVCRLQLVAAQALKGSFVDRGNAPGFSATPLAPGTISKLDRPDSAVKTITQRFASFGGRGAEEPGAFYTRISERLRHKDRATALWDYERLILEAFPQIYKVKCLNHTCYEPSDSGAGVYRELAPGHVTVVTVPRLQFPNQRDPLKPYTSLGLLQDIEAFLKKRVSCFVKLHVRNPRFEEIRVSFRLRLFDGFDETFTSNQLRERITRFLSPWAFTEGGSPSFGGKIYKSVLVNFVEDQDGVDYVTDFQVLHDVDGVPGTADLDEVEGSTAVSILVSAPASKHAITVIKPALASAASEPCACGT